jgi:hypothetical protein
MPMGRQRITNGHVGAVCGLVIAGLSMGVACKIAGAPQKAIVAHLPKDWHTRRRPAHKWRGDRLAALQRAYGDRSMTVETIARSFKTTASMVRTLARRHKWPRRPRGMVSNETRLMYRRLRPFAGSPALAAS